jgi:uncharacterized membrane protein YqjE
MDAPEAAGPEDGLKAALARLAESGFAALRTRAELAGVELAQERDRLLSRAAHLAGGVVLLAFAALFVGAFVIVLFWDTYRLQAIAAVALLHAVGGLMLFARARSIARAGDAPFAATLAELDKDRARFTQVSADRDPV